MLKSYVKKIIILQMVYICENKFGNFDKYNLKCWQFFLMLKSYLKKTIILQVASSAFQDTVAVHTISRGTFLYYGWIASLKFYVIISYLHHINIIVPYFHIFTHESCIKKLCKSKSSFIVSFIAIAIYSF